MSKYSISPQSDEWLGVRTGFREINALFDDVEMDLKEFAVAFEHLTKKIHETVPRSRSP